MIITTLTVTSKIAKHRYVHIYVCVGVYSPPAWLNPARQGKVDFRQLTLSLFIYQGYGTGVLIRVWIRGMDRGAWIGREALIHSLWIEVWIEWRTRPDPSPKLLTGSHIHMCETYMCVCVCLCLSVSVCVCLYVCMYVCAYAQLHEYVPVCTNMWPLHSLPLNLNLHIFHIARVPVIPLAQLFASSTLQAKTPQIISCEGP